MNKIRNVKVKVVKIDHKLGSRWMNIHFEVKWGRKKWNKEYKALSSEFTMGRLRNSLEQVIKKDMESYERIRNVDSEIGKEFNISISNDGNK